MIIIATIGIFLLLTTTPLSNAQKSINWSGYNWFLRDQINSYPGPNDWSSNNIRIDSDGHLHLKIARSSSGGWTSAELYTKDKLGFGTYRWFVEGAIDKFSDYMVLGLFNYGGTNATNEIDIEIAKWGIQNGKNLFSTIWPSSTDVNRTGDGILMSLHGTYTTHQFIWTSQRVRCQSQEGFKNSLNEDIIFKYETPPSFASAVPSMNARVHMNLWNFEGKGTREVEVIIHKFEYIPMISKK